MKSFLNTHFISAHARFGDGQTDERTDADQRFVPFRLRRWEHTHRMFSMWHVKHFQYWYDQVYHKKTYCWFHSSWFHALWIRFFMTSDSDFDIYTQDYFQRPEANTGNVSQGKPALVCLCNVWIIFRKGEHYWRTRGLSARRNKNIPGAHFTNMI